VELINAPGKATDFETMWIRIKCSLLIPLLDVIMKAKTDCKANFKQESLDSEKHSKNLLCSKIRSLGTYLDGANAVNIPFIGGDRYPPAFDLAKLCIRDFYLQREPWNPDRHF